MNYRHAFSKHDTRQSVVSPEGTARDNTDVVGNDNLGFFAVLPNKFTVSDLTVMKQVGVACRVFGVNASLDFVRHVVFLSGINRGCHPPFAKRVALLFCYERGY